MQTIELKIEDNYMDSVMNILKSLKDDMIKEIHIKNSKPTPKSTSPLIDELDKIINTKSKKSITVDRNSIFNPHEELCHDIS